MGRLKVEGGFSALLTLRSLEFQEENHVTFAQHQVVSDKNSN